MHFKIKTELKVEREANNQMNIIIAKNKVAPIITALIKPPITDIDDPLYIEQTPAKRVFILRINLLRPNKYYLNIAINWAYRVSREN